MPYQPDIVLQTPDGARLEACLHGGHITAWRTADGRERLFLSERAEFHANAAIRGGVPVIFPQFAGRGALPKHGFARTARWHEVNHTASSIALRMESTDATRAIWPHEFVLTLTAELAPTALTLSFEVLNTDSQAFSFTSALHTYLRVTQLAQCTLLGLENRPYLDSTRRDAPGQDAALVLRGEIDRIYPNLADTLELRDGAARTSITQQGFTDVVVWTPGAEKAAALADLAPEAHQNFLCVEAAQIMIPITLAPGTEWRGEQRLSV